MSIKLLRRSGLVLVLGLVVIALSLQPSLAGGKTVVTAVGYSDLVRFQAQEPGVATLRVEVFDLGGQRLFDSGPVSGQALDWRMMNEQGKRVAYGVYLYVATAWDANGKMLEQRVGKLAIAPGGTGLGLAPALTPGEQPLASEDDKSVRALAYVVNDDLEVHGSITAIATGSNNNRLWVEAGPSGNRSEFTLVGHNPSNDGDRALFQIRSDWADAVFSVWDESTGIWYPAFRYFYLQNRFDFRNNQVDNISKLGIGTTSPSATLEVHGSQPNLLALYDPADTSGPKFKVKKDGNVYADGAYYCGRAGTTQDPCLVANQGADVAERINVSEWVEQGNVVEIDPEHAGFFRKARGPYSTLVAGVISTTPGITLGNNFDAKADIWKDNRPLLALTGRVPVKVTTENGPIQVGDLLVSSSTTGYAMRCGEDRAACVGATIGKALEPLEEGTGTIMAQIMLR